MNADACLRFGTILGFLGVALGSFGAHGLEGRLDEYGKGIFETAVKYQMYHALALVALGAAGRGIAARSKAAEVAGAAFLVGALIFSGTLYALALTGQKWLGAITPIGGVGFLVGWAAWGVHAWRVGKAE